MDEAEQKYQEFQDKVKRTVCIASLSPKVTLPIVTTSFNQFGTVKSVLFVPDAENLKNKPHLSLVQMEYMNKPRLALVEMENVRQAEAIIVEMTKYPFMMSGMPRPVKVIPAQPEMFVDRPKKPGRKTQFRWLEPNDPNFQVAMKLKELTEKHRTEVSFLLKQQLEEQRKLHSQQAETLNSNYTKFKMIDKLGTDGTMDRVKGEYWH